MTKDFELKVRLSNILWSLGCYTRIEVKLSGYSPQKESALEVTDLDVLGIRISPDLGIEHILADCTSNKNIVRGPIQRVFWLKGVMDFFGASRGYLGLGSNLAIPGVQRVVGSRLGVTILNESDIGNLEKRLLNEHLTKLKLSAAESWLYLEGNLSGLAKELTPLLEFRKYRYWMISSHESLHALISLVSKHKSPLNAAGKFGKALTLDLLILFAVSLLKMSAYVSRINPENPELELKNYFYGGYFEMRRRESIVENIRKLVEALPGQQPLFDNILKLDPDYLSSLFEVAYRFLNRPRDSAQIPRYLQSVLFERTLHKGENPDGTAYIDEVFSDVTKKLSRDLARFFCQSTGLPEKIVEEIFEDSKADSQN